MVVFFLKRLLKLYLPIYEVLTTGQKDRANYIRTLRYPPIELLPRNSKTATVGICILPNIEFLLKP